MGTAIGDLVVNLLGNGAPLRATLSTAQGDLGNFASKTQGIIGKAFSALGVGGILMGAGAAATAAKLIGLATVQEQAEKKLASVLRSTGGAAGLSARQLYDYASQLQAVTNYGDEATISAMSVLATFTQIKGDVFKGAIAAAQDLSAIMGQDLQSSVVQIGKALNDPIKGITALQRVGVSFTKEQKKAIEDMVKAGNIQGAQQAILNELKTEFGGAAQALADPLTQMKNAVGDLGEQLGFLIKPAFAAAARWFQGWVEWTIAGIGYLKDAFYSTYLVAQEFFRNLASSAFGQFVANLARAFAVGWSVNMLFGVLAAGAIALGSAIAAAIAVAMGPVGAIVVLLTAIGAALVEATGEGETFGEKLQDMLGKIPAILDGLAFTVRNFSALAQLAILDMVLAAIEMFPQLEGPLQAVWEQFVGGWAGLKAFFGSIIDHMIGGIKEVANALEAVWEGIKAAWDELKSGNWGDIADSFANAFTEALANQQNVDAPNAFAAAAAARAEAINQFRAQVESRGGFANSLRADRQELLDKIATNEQNAAAAAEAAKAAAAEKEALKQKPAAAAAAPEEKKKGVEGPAFAGASLRGTQEAWSTILGAMAQAQGKDPTAKAAEETAKNTARIADRLDELQEADLVEIAS